MYANSKEHFSSAVDVRGPIMRLGIVEPPPWQANSDNKSLPGSERGGNNYHHHHHNRQSEIDQIILQENVIQDKNSH
jgi:hypothetical protein